MKPRDAMKQQLNILHKKGKTARLVLMAATIGLLYAVPAMHGAGMNKAHPSCSSATPTGFFKSLYAVLPAGQPLLSTEEDRQQKPDTTISRTDDSAPAKLFLDQNYPNPFRFSTSVRYGLPKSSFVKVTIHTMLGSPIKTILEETQSAGVYTLEISVPDLMPGIYFYRVQTEYGAITRRLTISR